VDVATDASFTTLVIADTNVGNVTSSAITGLASGTQHWTRVRAVNADGTSSNSNTITFTTTSGAPNPPDDPIATSATNIYWNAFTANWGASSGATGHRLDISVDNFSTFVEGFNDLDVGNVTSYAVSGLQGSITYYYRVRAYNGDGFSAESNTISLTTLIAPPVPDLPRGRLLIHY
jgi:predicted phage tail protein